MQSMPNFNKATQFNNEARTDKEVKNHPIVCQYLSKIQLFSIIIQVYWMVINSIKDVQKHQTMILAISSMVGFQSLYTIKQIQTQLKTNIKLIQKSKNQNVTSHVSLKQHKIELNRTISPNTDIYCENQRCSPSN